jgi:nucleotide-binding universal stress UspA family protein
VFSHILVPLDGSPQAKAAIPTAIAVAERFSARITLLEVIAGTSQVVGGAMAAESFGASGSVAAGLEAVEAAEEAAGAYLDAVRDEFARPDWGAEVGEGDAADVIVATARRTGADLIVMATHARTGLRRFFQGSVTEAVVREAGIPVLSLRAPD